MGVKFEGEARPNERIVRHGEAMNAKATYITRLTVTSGTGADKIKESRKVCDFLFERCGGDIWRKSMSKRSDSWRKAVRQARAIRKRKYKLRAVRTLFRHLRAALWPAA